MRARRPSTPSSIAAKTIAATAHSSLSSTARRIAVKPAHSASSVIRLGSSVRAGAEADHADALAGGDRRTFAHETDDAARHQSRDLHYADALPVARDEQRVALVALARFVEVGAEEGACVVDDALDLARERTA